MRWSRKTCHEVLALQNFEIQELFEEAFINDRWHLQRARRVSDSHKTRVRHSGSERHRPATQPKRTEEDVPLNEVCRIQHTNEILCPHEKDDVALLVTVTLIVFYQKTWGHILQCSSIFVPCLMSRPKRCVMILFQISVCKLANFVGS